MRRREEEREGRREEGAGVEAALQYGEKLVATCSQDQVGHLLPAT